VRERGGLSLFNYTRLRRVKGEKVVPGAGCRYSKDKAEADVPQSGVHFN